MRKSTENIVSKFGWILLVIGIIVLLGVLLFSFL